MFVKIYSHMATMVKQPRKSGALSLFLSHALSFHFSLPDNKHQFSQIFQLILSSKSDNMVECRLVAVVSAILTMRHRRSSCLKLWWCMYTIIKKQQTLIIDKRMSVYVWLKCDYKKKQISTLTIKMYSRLVICRIL